MRQFSARQSTVASPSAVWKVWQAVDRWHEWDTELESSELDGPFAFGAEGWLQPKNAPRSRFTITEFTDGVSFTYGVPMPLARLEVAHYFIDGASQTTFVHEVRFKGLLGGLFGRLLGKGYANALPGVLERIKRLAEEYNQIAE